MSISSLSSSSYDALQNQSDPTSASSTADADAQLAVFQAQLQQTQMQQSGGSAAGQQGQSGHHHHGGHHHHAPAAPAASGSTSTSATSNPPSVLSMMDAIPDARSSVISSES